MNALIEQPRYACALGAQQSVLAIPGALPIVHAGPGCSSKLFGFASFGAGFQGEGFGGGSHVSSTNTDEQDVVFGGESKLNNVINGALRILDGELFVVLTGCTADIIGDDSLSAARDFAARGHPVVGVETGGFKGNNYFGHEEVIKAIVNQFVGEVEPVPRPRTVNVFSVLPYQNPFWRGDLEEIKRLLEGLGLGVNILFGGGSQGVREWRAIPHAAFNLLLSPSTGLETAELLRAKYRTDFLHYPVLPVGGAETSRFLREVSAFAGLDSETAENFIAGEEKRFYDYFVSLADFISEYRNNLPSELYLVADSIYGPGLSSFLVNELGFIPRGIYLTDAPADRGRRLIERSISERGGFQINFESDGGLIEADIRRRIGGGHKAVILGSSWEKFIAQDTGNLYLYVSLPLNETVVLNKTYVGYNGGLNLMADLYSSLFSRKTTTSRTQLFTD
ncbi:MAG: hydrogenase [Candidatus Adiutrix sp.]|jgi:nitrogenase molybdenum-iron protein beta chain|nr:hydrogenase [Candidatus Adiutrix sp.]